MASAITSGIAKLNPFSKKGTENDEDAGEEIDSNTVAGGGHSARQTAITKNELRVSHAIKSFLVSKDVLAEQHAALDEPERMTDALKAILDKPHINVPPQLTDRSHPLPEYFISSSHNTYLMAHQLYGTSSATAYETALNTGSRCVEIDAWDGDDNKDEPKVTHGFTLVSNIPFRAVCETIRDVVDKEAQEEVDAQGYRAAPILISLENHCGEHGQRRLAQIMKEVWGDRLLSKAIRDKGTAEQQGSGDHVRLEELGSKIVVIVEYHFVGEKEDDSDSSSSSDEDESDNEKNTRKEYKEKKKEAPPAIIIPELAELGVYAQSVKPADNSWYESELKGGPHHHLINVSESGLLAHLPKQSEKIGRHNAHHLMRVFPKGTRISSANLKPVPYWGIGAQICALNWQTFGASAQLNEALFSGSDGFVLKPAALRAGGSGKLGTGKKIKLRLHVGGASNIPLPKDRKPEDIKPYISCTLVHPDDLKSEPPKKKTSAYKQHKLSFLHKGPNPSPTDPVWDEVLEWEYEENEMTFLRILLKSDDSFTSNPVLVVAAVRLMYAAKGWSFIRMLDRRGHETTCTLLVKFEFEHA
jgi:phosphatidylinositol phospholipase C delta